MSTRRKPLKAKRAVSLRPTRRPSRDEPSWERLGVATGGRSTGGVGIGRGSATVNISRIGETTPRVFRSPGGGAKIRDTAFDVAHTRPGAG